MNAELGTWIGYIAGTLTTLAFLPQVKHVWRRKCADDLHLGTLVAYSIGIALWLIYGLAIRQWPVILPNAVTLILQLSILGLKLRYMRSAVQPHRRMATDEFD